MANCNACKLTQVESVQLGAMAEGVERVVTLTDDFLAPQLSGNIMSLGKLEQKGFKISYRSGDRSRVRMSNGAVAFDVRATARLAKGAIDVIMAVLTAYGVAIDPANDVKVGCGGVGS
ncbi:unnamed protein product [Peronospora belbahrii]|uniref:Uncharacterized protein n=1 Tax=Peronospora belbahrii TaxID=622444 RepID=A0ABN8D8E4_9STRA|nr:unnamed protein product [Peronospora belbahrii]